MKLLNSSRKVFKYLQWQCYHLDVRTLHGNCDTYRNSAVLFHISKLKITKIQQYFRFKNNSLLRVTIHLETTKPLQMWTVS